MATRYISPTGGASTQDGLTADTAYAIGSLATAETEAGSSGTILFLDGTYSVNFDVTGLTYQSLNKHGAAYTNGSIGSGASTSPIFKDFVVTKNADYVQSFGSETIIDGCLITATNINQGFFNRTNGSASTSKFINNILFFEPSAGTNRYLMAGFGFFNELSGNTFFVKTGNLSAGQLSTSVGSQYISSSNTFKNNILATDDATNGIFNTVNVAQHASNCCFHQSGTNNTSGGTNNKFSDPLFVDSANSDYRLRPSSPCINAGTA
tara:strand:+ start:242 stop:1036 length:795 start_codon:yes stop_codon:yes gene_type:complete